MRLRVLWIDVEASFGGSERLRLDLAVFRSEARQCVVGGSHLDPSPRKLWIPRDGLSEERNGRFDALLGEPLQRFPAAEIGFICS